MTLWATLEYLKNEDVIEISYRKFDQTKGDSQYPAMSLCFVDAYKQSELEKWNNYSSTNNTNDSNSTAATISPQEAAVIKFQQEVGVKKC